MWVYFFAVDVAHIYYYGKMCRLFFVKHVDKSRVPGFDFTMTSSKRLWGTLDPFFEPGPVLGRKVANTTFLHALLHEDAFDEYHFFLADQGQGKGLIDHLTSVFPALVEAERIRVFDRRELPRQLSELQYHCFHLSDCMTTQPYLSRLRNRYSRELFPITGTIHSLSYAEYGGSFLRHLWPGTTKRDAIVCTSSAGRQAVENFFSWLRRSYQLDEFSFPAPELATVPLAVDAGELTPCNDLPDGGPVRLLVFGRISHHSKMDLLPLVRALHRLIQDGQDPSGIELVLAGWADDDDDFLPTLKDYVANVGIPLTVKLRPNNLEKLELFQSADIFVSIADNPQETFGITLLEAGACGLPVIASDYDGYRDIVVHGETGLLVPTFGPDATIDANMLAPLTYGNQYHLLLAQRTAVEIPALAGALQILIGSPEMRQVMGQAARQRVLDRFTWETVIKQYITLWDELWHTPVDAEMYRHDNHPQAMPYGDLFGHYTTEFLAPETMLRAGRTGEAFYRDKDYPTLYSGMSLTIDPNIAKKLVFLARKPIDTDTLIRKLVELEAQVDVDSAKNHILWSLKQDILERIK